MKKENLVKGVSFTHSDGSGKTFRYAKNPLSGDWMSTWDDWKTCSTSSLATIKATIHSIRTKAKDVKELPAEKSHL